MSFDWKHENQILEKIEEELIELKQAAASNDSMCIDEIGDLLLLLSTIAASEMPSPE